MESQFTAAADGSDDVLTSFVWVSCSDSSQ